MLFCFVYQAPVVLFARFTKHLWCFAPRFTNVFAYDINFTQGHRETDQLNFCGFQNVFLFCSSYLFMTSVSHREGHRETDQLNFRWFQILFLSFSLFGFMTSVWHREGHRGIDQLNFPFLKYVIIFWTVCKRKIAVRPPSFLNKNNLTQPGTERNCSTELFFYFSKSGFSLWHFLSY